MCVCVCLCAWVCVCGAHRAVVRSLIRHTVQNRNQIKINCILSTYIRMRRAHTRLYTRRNDCFHVHVFLVSFSPTLSLTCCLTCAGDLRIGDTRRGLVCVHSIITRLMRWRYSSQALARVLLHTGASLFKVITHIMMGTGIFILYYIYVYIILTRRSRHLRARSHSASRGG